MFELVSAIQTYKRGDFANALSQFQDLLTKEPENATAHAHLCICLLAMRKPFAAMQEADRALAANPELALAHVARAHVANQLDDLSGAEAAVREALRIDPENTDALLVRCSMALGERDGPAIRAAAEVLLQQEPDSMNAHYFLSRAASLARDGETAERHAREALRLQPNEARAHEAIGWAFWAQRDLERARDAGLSALAIDPNSQGPQALLSAVEMQLQPLTGWLHRVGMILNQFSLKQTAVYLGPPLLVLMLLRDVLRFADYDTIDRVLNYGVLAFGLFLIFSTQTYAAKASKNQKAARLRRDY